ncbi:alpha/beta hydrolase [Specibacter cremeus]|uniref:alpha/beta hydrolase n=1 Tax=Specibacter cremeus TaxID=1629051 RepID=UPI00197B1E7C|nr:alpha/beta hydrolase [Specibacter cremeus]
MRAVPVPIDPEIAARMAGQPAGEPITRETLVASRAGMAGFFPPAAEVIGARPVRAEERLIPGPAGELEVTIIRPAEPRPDAPGLYNMHGGGLIMGTRHMDTGRIVDLVEEFGFVAVNVEYRLAPEHPYLAPMDDCYAGLDWMAGHAGELGFDAGRLFTIGGSAGGLLSASMALQARDNGGPAIAGQVLLVPMLDYRNTSVSTHQYPTDGPWSRHIDVLSWDCVLGDLVTGDDVSPYVAPANAADLSGLPPAYIELGSAETLRDEALAYATRIWAAGGEAELHIWSGGTHGFEMFHPDTRLAHDALAARSSWFRRMLAR